MSTTTYHIYLSLTELFLHIIKYFKINLIFLYYKYYKYIRYIIVLFYFSIHELDAEFVSKKNIISLFIFNKVQLYYNLSK